MESPRARLGPRAAHLLLLALVAAASATVACEKAPEPMPLAASSATIAIEPSRRFRDHRIELRTEGLGAFDGRPFEPVDMAPLEQLVRDALAAANSPTPDLTADDAPVAARFVVQIERDAPFGRAAPTLDVLRRALDGDAGQSFALLELAPDANGVRRAFPVALRSAFATRDPHEQRRDVTIYLACVHAMPPDFAPERPWNLIRTPPEEGFEDSSTGRAMSFEFALDLLERDPPVRSAVLVTRVLDNTPWRAVIELLDGALVAAPDELQFDVVR